MTHILAIDQSTSATKAVLFDRLGRLVASESRAHAQGYPRAGWVEHDPEEIFRNTLAVMAGVLAKVGAEAEIAALAIANQRETVVVWDRRSGKPVCNALVWQDQRGLDICKGLSDSGHDELIQSRTGLRVDPYFSASKVGWVLENVSGARQDALAGHLALGTIDSWLLYRLTGRHATDYSNASRTMLFDITKLAWDGEVADLLSIPLSMLPEPCPSDHPFGQTDGGGLFRKPVPIAGILGDSHGSLFGLRCVESGTAKASYGTGSSIMLNIGPTPLRPGKGLVTSIAWGRGDQVDYVFEGNIHHAADTIRWLVDDIGLLANPRESEQLARSVPDNNGVYLVPAFSGLGAPYWDNRARASITGMARNTNRAHLIRAAEESIAYQVHDLLEVMVGESGVSLAELRVDGGATRDEFLMQFQADLLDVPVVRAGIGEVSALGAALMAGLATGFWEGADSVAAATGGQKTFRSALDSRQRQTLLAGWREAVRRTLSTT